MLVRSEAGILRQEIVYGGKQTCLDGIGPGVNASRPAGLGCAIDVRGGTRIGKYYASSKPHPRDTAVLRKRDLSFLLNLSPFHQFHACSASDAAVETQKQAPLHVERAEAPAAFSSKEVRMKPFMPHAQRAAGASHSAATPCRGGSPHAKHC